MAFITEASLRAMHKKGIRNPFRLQPGERLTPAAADYLKERGIPLLRDSAAGVEPAIPVGVSNRHVHLSPEHVEALFGPNYVLRPLKELSQPGQFAAEEQVTLLGPKGSIGRVRVLGPSRGATQVEITRSDGFVLGVHPPVRLSGSHEDTPGITLIGPYGSLALDRGVIVAKCHVHMSPIDAERFRVADGDTIMLQTSGPRVLVFADAAVRVSAGYRLDFHVDLDEANAANLQSGDSVVPVGRNGSPFAK